MDEGGFAGVKEGLALTELIRSPQNEETGRRFPCFVDSCHKTVKIRQLMVLKDESTRLRQCWDFRGTSLIRSSPPPEDYDRTLGIK